MSSPTDRAPEMPATPAPKVALVTGASCGIGRAAAIDLAAHGFDVVLTARSLDASAESCDGTLRETAERIERLGRRGVCVAMDMAVLDSVRKGVSKAFESVSHIDVVIAAANSIDFSPGGTYLSQFVDTRWAALERHLTTNCLGTPLLLHQVAPHMLERGSGVIMNVTQHLHGSLEKARGGLLPGHGASGIAIPVSRGVTERLAPTLAREFAPHGVTILTLDPGMTLSTDPARIPATSRAGFDAEIAHSVVVPARAVTYLATCREPHKYNGALVSALDLVRRFELMTADEIWRPWRDGVQDVQSIPSRVRVA